MEYRATSPLEPAIFYPLLDAHGVVEGNFAQYRAGIVL